MLPRCLLALPCISLLMLSRSSSAFVSAYAPGCIHISQDGAGFKTPVACNELRFGAGSVTKMKMSGKEFEDYGSKRASFEPSVALRADSEQVWPNYYSAPNLDRSAKERLFDDDAFESAIAAATARVAIISQGKNLVRASSDGSGHFEAVFLSAAEADALVDDPGSVSVSLGSYGGADYFACDISHLADFEPPSGTAFEQLRSVGGALGRDEDAGLLAVARGMAVWHRSVRCCQSCGSKDMAPAKAGSMRRCGACGAGAYPRIDPSVIVLVTACDGELALLGRKANWPEGRYSTLAGFCEVGESLEETVVREVFEESGVKVVPRSIDFKSSQTWPFPRSLMVAFNACAEPASGGGAPDVSFPEEEMEHVRWFSRAELRAGLVSGELSIPGRAAVAHQLINAWLDGGVS